MGNAGCFPFRAIGAVLVPGKFQFSGADFLFELREGEADYDQGNEEQEVEEPSSSLFRVLDAGMAKARNGGG